MSPEDLGLLTTDALLDELERRFDVMVFGGLKNKREAWMTLFKRTSNDYVAGLGLVCLLREKIERDYTAAAENDDEEGGSPA